MMHHGFGANMAFYGNAEIQLTVSEPGSARQATLD